MGCKLPYMANPTAGSECVASCVCSWPFCLYIFVLSIRQNYTKSLFGTCAPVLFGLWKTYLWYSRNSEIKCTYTYEFPKIRKKIRRKILCILRYKKNSNKNLSIYRTTKYYLSVAVGRRLDALPSPPRLAAAETAALTPQSQGMLPAGGCRWSRQAAAL
jgi:hypothetical protein